MAYRLVVRPTHRCFRVDRLFPPAIMVMILLAAGVSRAQEQPAAGPDVEAFRTAKAAYFRNPQQAADLFRAFLD